MAMNEKGLGKRIQAARTAAGLTQQQLCHQANISFSTLTKIERGAIKAPSVFTIQSIAGVFGMGLDELVGAAAPHALNSPARPHTKTRSGVSFIYFDVNGCLVHFYQRAFTKIAEATGVPSDVVETAFWHYNDDVCRGIISLDEFNENLAQRIGVPDFHWEDYYLETIEPIKEMQELLVWASERYKVGLLTNIMPGLLNHMLGAGQLPNIKYDAIIDSSVVAAIKPEQKIYEIAQEHANCPPSEILLIDDARANLMAAERLGWHVLWFDDARPVESVAHVRDVIEPAS